MTFPSSKFLVFSYHVSFCAFKCYLTISMLIICRCSKVSANISREKCIKTNFHKRQRIEFCVEALLSNTKEIILERMS